MLRLIALLGIALSSASLYGAETLVSLNVKALGAEPLVGQALFNLFDSKQTHLKTPLREASCPIDAEGNATFQIENIPAGTYSFSVVYDKDGDGQLKTNFLGIPKEKVAVSNNPKARFGPPSFKDSAIELSQDSAFTLQFTKAR